jgi:hypothetical protein
MGGLRQHRHNLGRGGGVAASSPCVGCDRESFRPGEVRAGVSQRIERPGEGGIAD